MSGAKETPRQKMIGMMYLVLTALLALNVSKEILNAFIAIEESLNTTNMNFDTKNKLMYAKFKDAYNNDQKKVKPYYDNALKAQKYSKELCDTIDAIKSRLYANVQGGLTKSQADTFQLKYLDSKDNYDIPTRIMIGDDPEHATGAAVGLKKQIEDYKKKMADLITDKNDRANLKLGLDLKDIYSVAEEKTLTWEDNNFYHSPIAAVFSVMAKLKTDTKNAEGDVVAALFKAIDAASFKFDVLEGKVFAPTNYIISGDKYTADIFVSAHSNTVQPEVLIGPVDSTDRKNPKIIGTPNKINVDGGVGKYEVSTGAEGLQQYSGIINVKGPDGNMNHYPFHGEYMVAKPSMAISPTKMNVFYIGVDNPVSISVAGAAPTDVVANLTGATGAISSAGKPGEYVVKVTAGTTCDINVSIKQKTASKSMGKQTFRVKKVPSPNASFAGITGDGSVSAADLQAAGGVIPKLDDFVFDLQFPVVSWNMSMMVNGVFVDAAATGPKITDQQRQMLQKAKKGGRVLIEQVLSLIHI